LSSLPSVKNLNSFILLRTTDLQPAVFTAWALIASGSSPLRDRIQRTPHTFPVPDLRRVGIDLRCLHVRVAQQFLQSPDIRPAIQEMRREGVT
jgi:hypothetical protein